MNVPWKNLPEKFIERLGQIVPSEKREAALQSFCQAKLTTFRANGLKTSAGNLKLGLANLGFEIEGVEWCPSAFVLKNKSQKELSETHFYKEGFLYLQSLSSLIPPLVLDPQPGEKVLDLCAAPGSKTTQMAVLMENRGEIYANDKSHLRNYKLKANLELQGVMVAKVFQYPGEIFWKSFPEQFDRTLVDVPCSLEGRFQAAALKSYEDWSEKKIRQLSDEQKWLLRSAISCTKPGGTIVYSTCTLAPEENEAVIDWILKKEKGNIDLEEIVVKDLEFEPTLNQWKNKDYDQKVSRAVRILPSELMEGFFLAKIRKLESNVHKWNG